MCVHAHEHVDLRRWRTGALQRVHIYAHICIYIPTYTFIHAYAHTRT